MYQEYTRRQQNKNQKCSNNMLVEKSTTGNLAIVRTAFFVL